MNHLRLVHKLISTTTSVVTETWRDLKWLNLQVALTRQQISSSMNQLRTSEELLRQIDSNAPRGHSEDGQFKMK
jgi:hypothetical protein